MQGIIDASYVHQLGSCVQNSGVVVWLFSRTRDMKSGPQSLAILDSRQLGM